MDQLLKLNNHNRSYFILTLVEILRYSRSRSHIYRWIDKKTGKYIHYSLHLAKGNFYQGPVVTRNCTKPLLGIEAILRSDNHDFQKSKTWFPCITMSFNFVWKSQIIVQKTILSIVKPNSFFWMFEITKTYVSFAPPSPPTTNKTSDFFILVFFSPIGGGGDAWDQ
jgi:hypothetical protein